MQEPVLFDRTIAENIQYGDNSRKVSMEEVIMLFKCCLDLFDHVYPPGDRGSQTGQHPQLCVRTSSRIWDQGGGEGDADLRRTEAEDCHCQGTCQETKNIAAWWSNFCSWFWEWTASAGSSWQSHGWEDINNCLAQARQHPDPGYDLCHRQGGGGGVRKTHRAFRTPWDLPQNVAYKYNDILGLNKDISWF